MTSLGISRSRRELDLAFLSRLAGSDQFVALAKIRRGWPKKFLEQPTSSWLPCVTYFAASRPEVADGPPRVEIQTDVWVWPDASVQGGGMDRLDDIDETMLELLTDDGDSAGRWADADLGIEVTCVCLDAGDPMEPAYLRRRRLWEVALG